MCILSERPRSYLKGGGAGAEDRAGANSGEAVRFATAARRAARRVGLRTLFSSSGSGTREGVGLPARVLFLF